ncbi:hypothetical protein [Clostridium butyricum]|nr:hypothetical protein [Clostridium butyricum]
MIADFNCKTIIKLDAILRMGKRKISNTSAVGYSIKLNSGKLAE